MMLEGVEHPISPASFAAVMMPLLAVMPEGVEHPSPEPKPSPEPNRCLP
ncbi:hypothetical protein [Myxococcus faecalis]